MNVTSQPVHLSFDRKMNDFEVSRAFSKNVTGCFEMNAVGQSLIANESL